MADSPALLAQHWLDQLQLLGQQLPSDVSYPRANALDGLQCALALAALYHDRQTNGGWPAEKLLPVLAGLDELVPWLQQWHDDPDQARGGRRMGQYFARFVEEEARKQGAAPADLRAWRPEARRAGKGRKGKA